MPVRGPHELCDNASEPVAIVDVERGLHAASSVSSDRPSRYGDGEVALRYDPPSAVEVGRVDSDVGSSGVDFVVGEFSSAAPLRTSLRKSSSLVVLFRGSQLGITLAAFVRRRFRRIGRGRSALTDRKSWFTALQPCHNVSPDRIFAVAPLRLTGSASLLDHSRPPSDRLPPFTRPPHPPAPPRGEKCGLARNQWQPGTKRYSAQ